jgi:hypothetical protein
MTIQKQGEANTFKIHILTLYPRPFEIGNLSGTFCGAVRVGFGAELITLIQSRRIESGLDPASSA